WSLQWPHALTVGLHTAVVKQSDDAGHTAVTLGHTFFVNFAPQVIGVLVNLDRQGYTNVEVTCTANTGNCTGTVTAVTASSFKINGHTRPLEVVFATVNIPAGVTSLVRTQVSPQIARLLRKAVAVEVQVSAVLIAPGAPEIRVSVP